MVKRCKNKDCDTFVNGTEEEVAEKFYKKQGYFLNTCKKCDYKKFKRDYYKPPSLKNLYDRTDAEG